MRRVSMPLLNSPHQCCVCHCHSFCIFFSNYCNDTFVTLSVRWFSFLYIHKCFDVFSPPFAWKRKVTDSFFSNKNAFQSSSLRNHPHEDELWFDSRVSMGHGQKVETRRSVTSPVDGDG